ncbi:MAG: hypothetical protein KDD40_12185, partial [Bdellovibrionales bacterium]|nr:hypothetical protein [Bdellovibrionales bacterium]
MKNLVLYLILLLISVNLHAAQPADCETELTQVSTENGENNKIVNSSAGLSLNQKQRLKSFFNSLTETQQQLLLQSLQSSNTAKLMTELKKQMEEDNVDEDMQKTFASYPGLNIIIFDLLELNQ